MHKNKIVHRDIKLENILLNFNSISNILNPNQESTKLDYSKLSLFDSTVKIADLGYSRELDGASLASTMCGTPITMAPDIIMNGGDKKYNSKADLWSLGAITYELLTGILPFNGNNINHLVENIIKGKYSFPSSLKISLEAIVFVNGLLQFYPIKRYDWNQIVSHLFIINETSSFTIIDIEKIDFDSNNCNLLENDTKDCGNFLWIIFKYSLKNISLNKLELEKFLNGEVDGFKKILQSNKDNQDNFKILTDTNESNKNRQENNYNFNHILEEKVRNEVKLNQDDTEDNCEIRLKHSNQITQTSPENLINENKFPLIPRESFISGINRNPENKIHSQDVNLCNTIREEFKLSSNEMEINTKNIILLQENLKRESHDNIRESGEDKIVEKEDIWEVVISDSITNEKIEITNFEINFEIFPEYFNIKLD